MMTTSTRRGWQWDWAGPHGTAWGTANACLSVLTAACSGRLTQVRWPVPTSRMVLAAVVVTVFGVILVLLRAAVRQVPTPAATILYKIACWVGAGGWLIHMYAAQAWTLRWFAVQVAVLVAMAVVGGLLAGLATDDPPPDVPPAEPAAAGSPVDPAQAGRDARAVEWETRLRRLCDVTVEVPNVEDWPRGNGYTVEALTPAGGSSWKTIAGKAEEIGADLDLPFGCRVTVQMGRSRRAALIFVMTVNALAAEQPYPDDYSPLTIMESLPCGVEDDGAIIGPDLRSKCMLLVGEVGSGKTNAGHVIGAGVARARDGLLWDIDMTGGGLFLDLLDPYLRGVTRQPAVDWAAWDETEAMFMTRAARRGGHARKTGYRDLMREVDDDKVPVSDKLPAIIIRADEIKPITGAPSQYPVLNENLSDIVFELRASAFRVVLLGLRATADIVGSDIQSQCHVIAVMRAKSDAEYAWAFGWHSGAAVADAPYPGCGFISLASGDRPVGMKWRRLRPKQLGEVGVAVDGLQPRMDELTRLALDGRRPDGTPMDDLLPDELDCYSTRWDRFRAKFGTAATAPGEATPDSAEPPPNPATAIMPALSGRTTTEAIADLGQVMANLAEEVAAAKARQGQGEDQGLTDEQTGQTRDEFDAMMAAAGFGADVDWGDPDNWANLEETPAQPDDEAKLLDLIRASGPAGAKPRDLLDQLRERHDIRISRDTLHERLRALKAAGKVRQPSHGRWATAGNPWATGPGTR